MPNAKGWRPENEGELLRFQEVMERELVPGEVSRRDPKLFRKTGQAVVDAAMSIRFTTGETRRRKERGRTQEEKAGWKELRRRKVAGEPVRETRKALKKEVKERQIRKKKQDILALGQRWREKE